jgi:hypothetical protein
MQEEIKQAESLISLYTKDRLELYQRIHECDCKIKKFESFIRFMNLIDKDMDLDDAKHARMIIEKYSTFKQHAVQEQAQKITKKLEQQPTTESSSTSWFGWWSTPAPAPTPTSVQEPPMEEFVILKEKIKLPEIPEEEMPK